MSKLKSKVGVSSWSRVQKILTCSMQNHIEKDLRIQPVVRPIALVYGGLLHDGLESIIMTDFEDLGYVVGLESLKDGLSDAVAEGLDLKGWTQEEYNLMGEQHLQSFINWARELDVETIGTEIELSKTMDYGDKWYAKVDWAFRFRNYSRTTVGLIDHKTGAVPLTEDFKCLDGQLAGYDHLWRTLGFLEDEDTDVLVGYTEFIKNKPQTSTSRKRNGPKFVEPDMRSVTEEAIQGFNGSIDAAVNLRRLPPFRNVGAAFSSPCKFCDVSHYCKTNELGPLLIQNS